MTATDNSGPVYAHRRSGLSRIAIQGVLWSLVANFTPSIVAGLVFLFTSRSLGPKEFGIVALASAIATVAGALAPLGFGEAIVQRKTIEQRHLDSVFWLCIATSVLLYGILLALTVPLANYFGDPDLRMLLPVLGLRIIFNLSGTVPHAVLGRTMSFDKMAIRTALASVLGGTVCLIALWLGYGLWALAISQLALSLTSCLGSIVAARWVPRLSYDPKAIVELGRFAGYSTAINFIALLNVEQILIGGLLGVTQLGLYGFARRIFQMLDDVLAGSLSAVSFSLLSSLQTDEARRRDTFLFASFASALLSFPAFAGLGAVAGDLVPVVFGSHWIAAIFVLQAFCAIGLLTCIGVLQSSLINSHGNANVWFAYTLIKQIVTAAYILLFNKLGVNAIMVALVVINYAMWVPTLVIVARILQLPLLKYLGSFAVPAIATAVMLLAVEVAKLAFGAWSTELRLAVCIAVGTGVYAGTVLVLAREQLVRMQKMVLARL